jgi:hypothetical protein
LQTHLGTKLLIAGAAFFGAPIFNPAHAATNRPPVISGTPATTVTVGKLFSFQPTARDADGNKLWFWANGRPAWATMNETTGRLYGTPTAANIGSYEDIQVVAYDGKARVYLPRFTLTVVADKVGQRPTISGAPVTTATVNTAYSFKAKAFDMDGDALTFSIVGKPAWAALDKKTGALTGTPTQVGVYPNVEVAVSDGTSVTKLPKFAVTVNPAGAVTTKSVVLSWEAPTQNTDGSALTNLSGYKIVYGTQAGNYTQSITLNGVGILRYTIENLKAGKNYFAVLARNSNGVESAVSPEISTSL